MTDLIAPGIGLGLNQAISIAESNYRVNVWEGAIRSGKTFSSQLRWLMYIAGEAPSGGQLLMVGRTRDSLYRSVIAPMQDPEVFGDLADQVRYTSGAPYATILGKRVHVLGAHDSKAEKAIRGMTLAGAYGDEATILSEHFFTQLLGRMSVDGAKAFFTTNPDSPSHWLKEIYLDRINDPINPLQDWGSWHFGLDDNPNLSEDYKNSIKSEFTGLFYKRFIEGLWVAAEGAVYDMWVPERHIVRNEAMPTIERYFSIGIDYGTTNATAAILLGLGTDGCLYAVDEWRYTPTSKEVRKTDIQLVDSIKTWASIQHDPHNPNATDTPIVVDPAAASFKVQLQQEGIYPYNAENDVLYGIRLISSLLSADKLKINERCAALIKEISGYTWDPKATREGIDAVIKVNDHSCDALRYAVATTENFWRRYINL